MEIYCKALDTTYIDKDKLFKDLKANKSQIIATKKAEILKSYEKGLDVTAKPLDVTKLCETKKEISFNDDFFYIAVNTTKILDSHDDVHINGLWKKTTKEQQGKNYLVDSHILGLKTTIAKKEHIEMFTAIAPFAILGMPYSGETEILIYKVRKDKIIDSTAKDWLESGDAIQASVRMQYVDIQLALKSDDPDDKAERKVYDKHISDIANKDDFDNEILYFFAIKEAKNVLESSLVLFGSNPVTGSLRENKKEPPEGTRKHIEPPNGTQEEKQKEFYLNYLK